MLFYVARTAGLRPLEYTSRSLTHYADARQYRVEFDGGLELVFSTDGNTLFRGYDHTEFLPFTFEDQEEHPQTMRVYTTMVIIGGDIERLIGDANELAADSLLSWEHDGHTNYLAVMVADITLDHQEMPSPFNSLNPGK